ncbi:MAG: 2-hydroxyacyl-CoA dehydratase family protein [Deltaproteobacteria bacterium]|nr:2-hydroxyacyl-CoA dehydratase family protein [Deltaproteobacteria bacterium]
MTRREYLEEQKEKGRRLIGVFPAHYPKEILWAFNCVPAEIWDPPLEVSGANAHLQPYICSVVKLGLELILQGKGDLLDGFLFPHTCDSIQNMASIVYDYLGVDKPCYFFYHPKAPYRPSSRRYYLEQLKSLVSRLESDLGPMSKTELKRRVDEGYHLASLLREIYDERRHGMLSASNADFYRMIRQGEYLHPDDFIPVLEDFLKAYRGGDRRGPGVILSGILPNPPEILNLLDELGVRVADDDLLCCGRRIPLNSNMDQDPFEALADSYFSMPPCTTKDSPLEARIDYLMEKIAVSKARGVIFYLVKFCEPEWFDVPRMAEAVKKGGAAVLTMDVDLNQGLSGQLTTRIEAFVEMIGRR